MLGGLSQEMPSPSLYTTCGMASNIISTYLYDKVFAKKGELKSDSELKKIRRELITHSKTKSFKLKLGNLFEISDNTKRRSIELLTTYGVPEKEADEKADEIYTKLLEALQKLMNDEEKQGKEKQ
jgi:hypothetical protein